jgi:hypothetical protein
VIERSDDGDTMVLFTGMIGRLLLRATLAAGARRIQNAATNPAIGNRRTLF